MPLPLSRLPVRDFAYLLGAAALAGLLAYLSTRQFETYRLSFHWLMAVSYFGAAGGGAAAYAFPGFPAVTWRKVCVGSVIMPLSAACVYSLVHQEAVLIVLPALLSLPGTLFGGAAALYLAEEEAYETTNLS